VSGDEGRQLLQRAGRGSAWLLGGRVAHAGLRLISNMLVAGLLFPEAFGLMGLIGILLMGLELFSDTGVGPSIVRSPRGEDRRFLETAWTVQVLRGLLLTGVCWLLAGPYARFYEEPELARLIPLAGLTAAFQGLRSTSLFLADRQLVQGRKVAIGLFAQFLGMATMIIWAAVTRQVDALVIGSLVGTASYSLLSHVAMPRAPLRFRLDPEALRELFGFGRWIFVSTALTFLSMQGDRLFLGAVLLLHPLGLFFLAQGLVELVTSVLSQIASTVVFPTWVASARLASGDHVARIATTRQALNALGMAGLLCIAALAPALFRLCYDERYQTVPFLVQLLCIPAWLLVLKTTATSALLAYGDSRALSSSNLILLLVKIPACVAGYYAFGVNGFVIGSALGLLLGMIPMYWSLNQHGCRLFRGDLAASARLAGLGAAAVGLVALAGHLGPWSALLVELPVAALAALIAAAPARILLTMTRR
jgi:O-antigen/teichoic acid export membrane protein